MTRRDWIYGGLLVILCLALGATIGNSYRKRKEWQIVEKNYLHQMELLNDKTDEQAGAIKDLVKAADKKEDERKDLMEDLFEKDEELKISRRRFANRIKPVTLEECKVYAIQLEGNIVLLKKTLSVAEEEIYTLRDVLKVSNDYIDTVEKKLNLQYSQMKVLRRAAKKDRRVKIWTNILSAAGGAVVGITVGKLTPG